MGGDGQGTHLLAAIDQSDTKVPPDTLRLLRQWAEEPVDDTIPVVELAFRAHALAATHTPSASLSSIMGPWFWARLIRRYIDKLQAPVETLPAPIIEEMARLHALSPRLVAGRPASTHSFPQILALIQVHAGNTNNS